MTDQEPEYVGRLEFQKMAAEGIPIPYLTDLIKANPNPTSSTLFNINLRAKTGFIPGSHAEIEVVENGFRRGDAVDELYRKISPTHGVPLLEERRRICFPGYDATQEEYQRGGEVLTLFAHHLPNLGEEGYQPDFQDFRIEHEIVRYDARSTLPGAVTTGGKIKVRARQSPGRKDLGEIELLYTADMVGTSDFRIYNTFLENL